MGYIRHHTIVVTSWDEHVEPAWQKAVEVFGNAAVSPVLNSERNGYRSFFVVPDGSKEGWEESDDGDMRRAAFIDWLRAQYHSDGSTNVSWVEAQYADDNDDTKVTGSSDDDQKAFMVAHPEIWGKSDA